MKKINFAMGIHFHQPVDNFDHVFEDAYEKSYKPFIDVLERYPAIRLTLHYSGSLLEWIETNRPELLKRIRSLVARGQVEIMTGGFYEPILSVIPREDSLGQIYMLTEYIKDRLNFEPEGIWLTERIWEPHLPSLLHDARIKYTIVDDTHFRFAGLSEEQLNMYYTTEDQGKVISLFPSSERLRYTIPFRYPHESIEYLRSIATEEGNRVVVYGDDGEKFGFWPGTYNWVYEQKWLEHFFDSVLHESSWINILTLGDILKNIQPGGRVYIPTASYREMMEWALPAESGIQFEEVIKEVQERGREKVFAPYLRGGFWRNFLGKYPEANNMHKKMLAVSRKVAELAQTKLKDSSPEYIGRRVARRGEGLPEDIFMTHIELWRGQVNCPYWHGVFGGLYLGHLRAAVYRHLIMAERTLDNSKHGDREWIESEVYDFDCDGREEIIVATRNISFIVDPYEGGVITELDFKPSLSNLLNTLARRPEVYHKNIMSDIANLDTEETPHSIHEIVRSKGNNFHQYLFYDSYRRGMLIDHVFGEGTTLQGAFQNNYEEIGEFPWKPYTWRIDETEMGKKITLHSEGFVEHKKIGITKTILVDKTSSLLDLAYDIHNYSQDTTDVWFGIEFNFALLNGESSLCRYNINGKLLTDPSRKISGEDKNVSYFGIENSIINTAIELSFSKECSLWRYEVETISQSESGYEKEYQASTFIPNWKFTIEGGKSTGINIRLTLTHT